MSFDHNTFRAAVFAAFVAQDWRAVADALLILQTATGTPVLAGSPTQEQVRAWALRVIRQLRADAKSIDETGDLPPDRQCNNPDCPVHGAAARARLARRNHILVLMPSIPGVQ